jgi:hypothetical protein
LEEEGGDGGGGGGVNANFKNILGIFVFVRLFCFVRVCRCQKGAVGKGHCVDFWKAWREVERYRLTPGLE